MFRDNRNDSQDQWLFVTVLIIALAILFLLLCAPESFGQAPSQPPPLKIEGELKVKANKLVRLWPANVPDGAGVLWDWDTERVDGYQCGVNLFLAAPPGNHGIKLIAIRVKDGQTQLSVVRGTVVVEGVGEKPPGPTPPPSVKTEDEAKAAIGRIRFGNAGCTATVIYPRRSDGRWDILTAAHCTGGVGSRGRFEVGG